MKHRTIHMKTPLHWCAKAFGGKRYSLRLCRGRCWGMTLVSSKVLLNFGMQPWALVELRSVLAYGILIFLAR